MRAVTIASDFIFPLADRPGALAALAGRLRAADVNLLSIRALPESPGDHARIGCVPESADQFRAFADSAGLEITEHPVIYIEGVDQSGALRHILEQVAGAGINISSIEAVSFAGRYGAVLHVEPSQWPMALAVIRGSDGTEDGG
jgi:hypothetical protein